MVSYQWKPLKNYLNFESLFRWILPACVGVEIFFKMLCLGAKLTLSGFSSNLGSATILSSRHLFLRCRADPLANTKDKKTTSMEIAVEQDNFEVLIILLAGFAGTSAKMQLDFLKMILENDGEKQYAPEFKKNLEGLSSCEVGSQDYQSITSPCVAQVLKKQLQLPWYLNSDDSINVNMIQFAAAKGHTEILQLLLDHGYS